MRRNLVIVTSLGLSMALGVAQAQVPASTPTPEASAPRDYSGAIEPLARKLESSYVVPAIGARYAAALRSGVASGAYAGISDPAQIAKRLTEDLRAVQADGHLRVSVGGPMKLEDPGPGGPGPSPGSGPERRMRPMESGGGPPRPPAMEDAKWIADGVAYVKFNEFPGTPESRAAIDAFMKDHASARALIIDGRTHHGGSPADIDALMPYLYAKPTVLVDMDMAQSVARTRGPPPGGELPSMKVLKAPEGILRREHSVIPHPTEHGLFGAKVYYLISNRTGSAAEHLALAFKRTHRATLIGEHTAGANHFGGVEPLGDGLMAFIPVGRTFDPDTGLDWEGTGILPDVAVPAADALTEALKLAGVKS